MVATTPPTATTGTITNHHCAERLCDGLRGLALAGQRNRYPVSAVEVEPPVRRSRICRNGSARLPCRTAPLKQTVCRHRARDGFVGHVGRLDTLRHSGRDAFVTKSLKVSDQRRRCGMPVPLEFERRVRCPRQHPGMYIGREGSNLADARPAADRWSPGLRTLRSLRR